LGSRGGRRWGSGLVRVPVFQQVPDALVQFCRQQDVGTGRPRVQNIHWLALGGLDQALLFFSQAYGGHVLPFYSPPQPGRRERGIFRFMGPTKRDTSPAEAGSARPVPAMEVVISCCTSGGVGRSSR